jgi:hypothetical protein
MTIIVAIPHKLYDPSFSGVDQALVQVEVVGQKDGVTYFKDVKGVVTAAISTEVFTINIRQLLIRNSATMKPLKEWAVHVRRNEWDQFLGTIYAVDEEEANYAALTKFTVSDFDAFEGRGIGPSSKFTVSQR